MEFDNTARVLSEFSEAVRLPRQVSPAIFGSMVKVATDCIEQSLGDSDPLVTYLRTEPPVPMADKQAWNIHYGRIVVTCDSTRQGPTELRPDLVFHPLLMIAVLTHEGTHAIDPFVREASEFAQIFKVIDQNHPQYGRNSLIWTGMDNRLELHAVEKEVEVLTNLRAPGFLVREQLEYFNQQRPALLAARLNQGTLLEGKAVVIDLAREVYHLIEQCPFLAETPLLNETQNLLNYALDTKPKRNDWPEIMISSVARIRAYGDSYAFSIDREDIPFDEMIQTLAECQSNYTQHVELAAKASMPARRILNEQRR